MTHASMAPEAQARAGITPELVRISVGIEATEDLLEDLRLGLERVQNLQPATRLKSESQVAEVANL